MKKILGAGLAAAMLLGACSGGGGLAGPDERDDRVVDLGGPGGVTLAALTAFAECDEFLSHVQTNALEMVGPWGLDGGPVYAMAERAAGGLAEDDLATDTTTPAAAARMLGRLLYGDALGAGARATLKAWMADTRTGQRRVRAGLPAEWPAGDKTGTSLWPGMGSVYVDVGFVEPPGAAPLTFATYFRAARQHTRIDPAAEGVLAEVGRVIARYARDEGGAR